MSPGSEKKDDVFEEENSPSYTLNEYLHHIEQPHLEDVMMLGDDLGDACTYEKGYMKRQALFSCLTCTPEGNAGLCVACTLCHEGHEVLEVGTKRNFRCDCGNSKFGNFFCKLLASKDVENVENSYNHNFKGTYCTCNRQYPDPEVEGEEDMTQCCICEDWFHKDHLGLESSETIPMDDEGQALFKDLICSGCSTTCSFLTLYPQEIFVPPKNDDVEGDDKKGKMILEEAPSACSDFSEPGDNRVNIKSGNISGSERLGPAEISKNILSLKNCSYKGSAGISCQLGVDLCVVAPLLNANKSMFLKMNWRDHLCRCQKCFDFYQKKSIAFLLDKDDSVAQYEDQVKQKREEWLQQQEQNSLNMFNDLGHAQKVEFFSGIADLQNEMRNFLASHDGSKNITPDDVHQMFKNLEKKRRRQI